LQKTNPEFIVYMGPMFSGKTSRLLMKLDRYKFRNKKVVLFKPTMDDRYGHEVVVTHTGLSQSAVCVSHASDLLKYLADVPEQDVVAVDEAFMIKGIADVLIYLYKLGVTIVVSTLDLSATCKPFMNVRDLLVWATCVEKCSAVCNVCGCDAHYTYRKQVSDDEIQVGGADLYEARCFTCHPGVNNRP